MVTQLRPPELDELGIGPSLEALFERADLSGLEVDAQIDIASEAGRASSRLDAAIEVTVFRVVQEALDNALRHGAARAAAVTLRETADELLLCVRDEGCGFDPPSGPTATGSSTCASGWPSSADRSTCSRRRARARP